MHSDSLSLVCLFVVLGLIFSLAVYFALGFLFDLIRDIQAGRLLLI